MDRFRTLHGGNSSSDVPVANQFYGFIETIFHNGITAGFNAPGDPSAYCMNASVTRAQMAVFLLKGKYGADHVPPPATGIVFNDVRVGNFAADWIEELAGLGITTGCGNGNFYPNGPVTRAQMAVFLLNSEYGSEPRSAGLYGDLPGRRLPQPVRRLDPSARAASRRRCYGRLRRRRVLPRQPQHPRPGGGVSRQDLRPGPLRSLRGRPRPIP